MTKQVIWTKQVLETFIEEGNLNSRQEYIIRTRSLGYSISKQAEELHISVDQVNKEIAKLKRLYDYTQKTSKVLPPRKKNQKALIG